MMRLLQATDMAQWDAYVMQHAESSFFHLAGWQRVIQQALGHRCYYYLAEANGAIVGLLPLVHVNSLCFGNALISNAFAVNGGIIADNAAVFSALRDQALALAQHLQVDYLQLRQPASALLPWPETELYVSFKKPLAADDDSNFKAIPRKQRAMIRGAIKHGLDSHIDSDTSRFYRIFSESQRNLGTPVLSAQYFQLLKRVFGEQCEIMTICQQQRAVASVMSFYFKDQVLPYYGGGTAAARALKANDFMYWSLMQRAVARGCWLFDFGRSKRDSGAYHFKKHWGFEPEPLPYAVHLVNAKALPQVNPLNPRYQPLIAAWKRLPLPVSQCIGPWLAKDLA
jgi:FemAB-related protein (PEP-CTERM system-associated)